MTDQAVSANLVCPIFRQPYAITIKPGGITAGAEEHCMELNYTPIFASGSMGVGLNIGVTTAGTAATWACAIFARVTQGATKNVNGYIDVAELELTVGAGTYNPADMFVLSLQAVITNPNIANCSHHAYIALRDYGTDATGKTFCNLFWFGDQTIQTTTKVALVSTTADLAASHVIRVLVGTTPLWILCNSTGP